MIRLYNPIYDKYKYILILYYISAFILSQNALQYCFFLRLVYKNYLNVLIKLWPNPGLV